ncbi:MAG: cofactor-independent phosphoglycerate mutase [Bacteroidaceae bacterium]|nr:cofactor-independent phosphoglycerate mutase [Bacteroidaceae bacterium]MBR3855440.1 cofactor-independent phosphoglycerate mutase [Bacteroidaceae bacterium]
MKHIIILGDGMADWPIDSLGGKTIMQAAHTPYMDKLAREGRCGRLITVADGFHPGSEVANMSVLGYDLQKVYEGRGPLEAASIGVELESDELALRCNIVSINDHILKNHSAGHITTAEADILVKYLQEHLGNERVRFHTGIQYRHLLVIKGGDKRISCTPPHDIPGENYIPHLVKADTPEAEPTARLVNELIVKSQQLLARHPLNIQRVSEGKDPANSIWPWGGGYRPQMESLGSRFPQIKSGSVISAVDLIRGIGRYAGLRVLDVEGATGLYDTSYENKTAALLEALKEDDFVYLHVEASDEAGHEGNVALKIRTVENLDSRAVGPIYEAVKQWDEPVAIAILPDHPTPCKHRTHTAEPVPFLVWHPGITPDSVGTFDEAAANDGSYGLMQRDEFINAFMNN